MKSGKRIVLSTFGSFGDIHPYIAIALELKARGHFPIVATSEVYREKMDALGLEFRAVRPDMPSYDDPEALTKLAEDLIHQQKGTEGVIRLFTQNPREVYDDLYAIAQDSDLLLTHPLPLVGPIVAQQLRIPWISSVLSPVSLFSAYDAPVPPQMPALQYLFRLSPTLTRAIINIAMRKFQKPVEPIYRLRTELGMDRGENPLFTGQHSPKLVLALFSRLLAKPQPDWPANTLVTGFPFYDRRDYFGENEVDPALLQFLDAGEPPIVFTLGSSAFWVAKDFYRDSITAAAALGQRALLLIGHERNRPAEKLPPGMAAFEYAPFGTVLPRAGIVVHQGGVGTTGQAMRSGHPQLIVPHAHDQFDNASRVKRLGCARVLARPRYNAANATKHLRLLLNDPKYAANAAEVGQQVRKENGAALAVDAIEDVLRSRSITTLEHAVSY